VVIVSADKALKLHDLTPIDLAAKEGLGLLNGTAASVAVASLALHEANHLAVLAQILTAMGCEALHGTAESFHPFIAAVRPHRGQIEAAANILGFLSGSRLAMGLDSGRAGAKEKEGLAQDRYALRTSTQWIGPQLEDLMLATDQVGVELNSTTDNPLIDTVSGLVHHGGNFQAASLTSAMEKVRLGLQMLAKMLFAQCTEIMNPAMNRGLTPNLCADDPSLSFWGKGIDIAMAGYYSEIAFLSNPVSTHVQSAEMHNQALNSLALISARYTMTVVEIGSMMVASCLVMVCQALDLRVLQMIFKEKVKPNVAEMMEELLAKIGGSESEAETEDGQQMIIGDKVWDEINQAWDETTTLDLHPRCEAIAERATNALMTALSKVTDLKVSASELFTAVRTWKQQLSDVLENMYDVMRRDMFERHTDVTPPYLGQASRKVYSFVRGELGVPFHRGLVEDPTLARQQHPSSVGGKTIGSLISIVYDALRDGRLIEPVMAAVGENFDCKDNAQAARGD
jgi:phenylalanine ammonia-lyase